MGEEIKVQNQTPEEEEFAEMGVNENGTRVTAGDVPQGVVELFESVSAARDLGIDLPDSAFEQ